MAMIGMDVEQATASANKWKSQSDQLAQLTTTMNQLVTALDQIWKGTDATKFIHTDWPSQKKNLDQCKQVVDKMIQELKQDIEEQKNASSK
ncbi:MAG: hypothetical protein FWC46_02770 [Actinomycetia bacterium]|nr:hypothetical protein [Actinomycetes bacterium]